MSWEVEEPLGPETWLAKTWHGVGWEWEWEWGQPLRATPWSSFRSYLWLPDLAATCETAAPVSLQVWRKPPLLHCPLYCEGLYPLQTVRQSKPFRLSSFLSGDSPTALSTHLPLGSFCSLGHPQYPEHCRVSVKTKGGAKGEHAETDERNI